MSIPSLLTRIKNIDNLTRFCNKAVPAVKLQLDSVFIDIAEYPKNFTLEKTPNYQLAEYAVYCTDKTNDGLKVRFISKISETVEKDGISAMTPADIKNPLFPSVVDTVNFLTTYSR